MADDSLVGRSFKVSNFKCFGADPQGFDELKPINVIIGRNNSGKSALLDLISHCSSRSFEADRHLWHSTNQPLFSFSAVIPREIVALYTQEYGLIESIKNTVITWGYRGRTLEIIELTNSPKALQILNNHFPQTDRDRLGRNFAGVFGNPIDKKTFRRLDADRNICPEPDNSKKELGSNGVGATNVIQNYLNQATLDRGLIEDQLLDSINQVFAPDAKFVRILCRQISSAGPWEIFLEEKHKGLIPLSQSGSGLKTVILVLLNLVVVPVIEGRKRSDYVFAFEELENNVHPSLLRRLLPYIAEIAINERCLTFLTTHSSTTIDLFARNANAQLIHVRHNGKSATATTVKTYIDNCSVLDDLEVRASDLLQANCVIWVEGPSDQIYLNRWINLWSDGKLKEGLHYQCVFYGGRVLSHLECGDPTVVKAGLAILRLARHACVLIDSDKRTIDDTLNDTKQSIVGEIESVSGIAWVTAGREIENYIPKSAFTKWKQWPAEECSPYETVFDYINRQEDGLGTKYKKKKKVQLSEEIGPYMELEECRKILDLDAQMTMLCEKIGEWNGQRE